MRQFDTVNILDMIGAIGEAKLKQCLSGFSCPINPEIEYFLTNNAIEFAKKKLSITYFVVNGLGKIVAIFTLAHKPIEIGTVGLSNSKRKKISRYILFVRCKCGFLIMLLFQCHFLCPVCFGACVV